MLIFIFPSYLTTDNYEKIYFILVDHEPAYTPPPFPWGFYHMLISGYLDHQSTQFRLSASELLLFVSLVLVLINALYGIPNCDDLVS